MTIPKCPACGSTRVQYHYSTSTALGWAHIIENGVDVSENPNWVTSYYSCCNADCRHDFHIVEHLGEIDVVDDGAKPSAPTIEMPINDIKADEVLTLSMNEVTLACTSTDERNISKPTIVQRLDELEKKVDLIVSKISQM